MNDQPNFVAGEMGDNAGSPPFETMGATNRITCAQPGRGAHEPQVSKFMLQSVTARNGSTEKTVPGIVQTPLGGLMPGPNAIAPAVPYGNTGATMPMSHDQTEFGMGVSDSWPDGCPVPVR